MAGRLGHIDGTRRVGHVPRNGIRKTNYAFGFGGLRHMLTSEGGINHSGNNTRFSIWEDQVSGVIFSQTTSTLQPIYRSSFANFNGYPAVEWDTAGRYMLANTNGAITCGVNSTFAIVFQRGAAVSRNRIIGNGATAGYFISCGGTTVNISIGDNTTTDIDAGVSDNLPHIIIVTTSFIILDGVLAGTGIARWSNEFNGLSGSTASGSANTGRYATPLIAHYDYPFTQEEAIRLCNNINGKYAIY
jgi:hypothetical protein